MNIHVSVRRGPDWRRLFPWVATALFLLWVNGLLWWALPVGAAVYGGHRARQRYLRGCEVRAAVAARADRQHQQVMCGDERGVYGSGYDAWTQYRATACFLGLRAGFFSGLSAFGPGHAARLSGRVW